MSVASASTNELLSIPATYIMIHWVGKSPSGKTDRFEVIACRTGDVLGHIRWFGRWRQYAFFPATGTLYSSGCLREIQEFIGDEMAERRNDVNRRMHHVPPEAGE